MANTVGRRREAGAKSQFNFQLDNDVFNAVNEAAAQNGRSISSEVEHRLRVALDLEPAVTPLGQQRDERSRLAATAQLDALGNLLSASFQLAIVQQAALDNKPLSLAIDDWTIVTTGLAAGVRHIFEELRDEADAIPKMREALIRKLPEF